jgi:putative two-component system response regulator
MFGDPDNRMMTDYKILIVDDKPQDVRAIKDLLESAGYHVVPAYSGKQALKLMAKDKLDLAILGIGISDIDGWTLCRRIKSEEETSLLPVIIVTSLTRLTDKIHSIEAGADDFLTKPVNKYELLARVRSLLHMKSLTDQLISARRVIDSLAMAIEEKDPYTSGHSLRVGEYAAQLARAIGLSTEDQEMVRKAAILHDLGMIGVEKQIIHKPGTLNKTEFAEIKQHPIKSLEILEPLDLPRPLLRTIRHHHEWWNGHGYPDGLAADQIPLGARILSIADAFDAMTSQRPFRAAMGVTKALNRLEDGMNRQWDSELVVEFIKIQTQ